MATNTNDPRYGLADNESSGNDALDREYGKGAWFPGYPTTPSVSVSSSPRSPSAAPILPASRPILNTSFAIKPAPIDTIVFDDQSIGMEMMEELLYEDIAGLELANTSRYDLIDGQPVSYSPISNLASIYQLFNPNNIIATFSSSEAYFSRFGINLILRGMHIPYIDDNGDLVIEIDTVGDNEEIHYQIASSGTMDSVEV